MKLPPCAVRPLRAAVTLVCFLLTVEACARLEDLLRFDAPFWGDYTAERLRGIDDQGIPYNVPGARFQKWRNNRFGFRGPEIAAEKTPGALRVCCLGASESYGLYETAGKEWPSQLSDMLRGTRYQVVNCSVVGLSLKSYAAYLKRYVLPLEPDIVICYINPFFAVARAQPPPPHGAAQKVASTASARDRSVLSSRCLPKARQAVKAALESGFPGLVKRYRVWKNGALVQKAQGPRPKDAVSAAALADFSRDLQELVAYLESRGVTVLLATYPVLMDRDNLARYSDIFLDNQRFCADYSLTGMGDVQRRVNSAVCAVAQARGVALVDCAALVPKSEEFFGDNVHYTDRGARIVAQGIAARLAAADPTVLARSEPGPR